ELASLALTSGPSRNPLAKAYSRLLAPFRRPSFEGCNVGLGQTVLQVVVACILCSALFGATALSQVPQPFAPTAVAIYLSPALFVGLLLILAFGGFGRCFFPDEGAIWTVLAVFVHLVISAITAVVGTVVVFGGLLALSSPPLRSFWL